ncbi:MAG: hypothetical protein ACRD2B_16600 [Terriglobia bacterium]
MSVNWTPLVNWANAQGSSVLTNIHNESKTTVNSVDGLVYVLVNGGIVNQPSGASWGSTYSSWVAYMSGSSSGQFFAMIRSLFEANCPPTTAIIEFQSEPTEAGISDYMANPNNFGSGVSITAPNQPNWPSPYGDGHWPAWLTAQDFLTSTPDASTEAILNGDFISDFTSMGAALKAWCGTTFCPALVAALKEEIKIAVVLNFIVYVRLRRGWPSLQPSGRGSGGGTCLSLSPGPGSFDVCQYHRCGRALRLRL